MIPNGCEIASLAFQSCGSLKKVTIGTGCTTIGESAFNGCTALVSVTLPSTLRAIGEWAFRNCPALAAIAIPKGCQVNLDAFEGSETRLTEW
jgi:hypothetical protein